MTGGQKGDVTGGVRGGLEGAESLCESTFRTSDGRCRKKKKNDGKKELNGYARLTRPVSHANSAS